MRLLYDSTSINLRCSFSSKMHFELQIPVQIMSTYPHVRCCDVTKIQFC